MPLWVPMTIHIVPFVVKFGFAGQCALMEAIIHTLHNITNRQGQILDWDHLKQIELGLHYRLGLQ